MDEIFLTYKLNNEGKDKVERVRNAFDALLHIIYKNCPDSRYVSLVKTKLEEASFFAVKAVSAYPENQTNGEE